MMARNQFEKWLRQTGALRMGREGHGEGWIVPFVMAAHKANADGTTHAVISHVSEDRHGDILNPAGVILDSYLKNPVVMWAHDYEALPIGRALKIQAMEDRIEADVEWASTEFAQEVKSLYDSGFLHGWSVGFVPKEWTPRDGEDGKVEGYDIETWELLEFSAVPIPANPQAVSKALASGAVKDAALRKALFEALPKEQAETGTAETESVNGDDPLVMEKPYPNEHACRVREPGEFKPDSFRRTEREHEGKKYSVIMGKLKGEDTMTEQAYRYPAQTWEADEARSHCRAHDGKFEAATGEEAASAGESESELSAPPDARLIEELRMLREAVLTIGESLAAQTEMLKAIKPPEKQGDKPDASGDMGKGEGSAQGQAPAPKISVEAILERLTAGLAIPLAKATEDAIDREIRRRRGIIN